jgi:uncharacterized protein (TIGR03437 family)
LRKSKKPVTVAGSRIPATLIALSAAIYNEIAASAEVLLRYWRLILAAACALSSAAADYTTYIGDQYTYHVTAIAADSHGNTYVTGSRAVVPASAYNLHSLSDVFVSKVDLLGNPVLVATISGNGSEQANGIAVDPSGNIYLVGSTTSTDFPLLHPLQTLNGGSFLVKLGPNGSVIYSTYMGGTKGRNTLNAVAADAQGNAYVTGETFASDYPQTPGLPAGSVSGASIGGVSAAFFAKISPTGNQILYAGGIAATNRACSCCSSCFLSTLATAGVSIALDAAGNAYIAGNTNGLGVPATMGGFKTDGTGAFVAKVNASGTSLAYLTFFAGLPPGYVPPGGASAPTLAFSIGVDASGNAYVAGSTWDATFPATPSAFQSKFAGGNVLFPDIPDGFVAKLNPIGSALVWASFLGGTALDQANTIAVDAGDNVWVTGITQSADFPVSSGFPGGGEFLVEFNPPGSSLLYGARFPGDTVGAALALDASGVLHAAGDTGLVSAISPGAKPGSRIFGVASAAGGNLAGRIAPVELISIYGLDLSPAAPVSATFDADGFLPTTLGGIQVTIDGTPAPLLYVSATQINAVVPLKLSSTSLASFLTVTTNGTSLMPFRLMADLDNPKVFLRADGTVAAINQDGTPNTATNPAQAGSYVSIWATGVGGVPGLADGQMATTAQNSTCCVIYDLFQNAYVIGPAYAGAAPGTVNGVMQINFQPEAGHTYYLNGNVDNVFSLFVSR